MGLTFFLVFTDAWERIPSQVAQTLARTQFVPSIVAHVAGAGLAIGAGFILLATLLWGRVYCSVLCPLGLYQDFIWWLRKKVRSAGRLPFMKEVRALRWSVLVVSLAGTLVSGGMALAWFDPYSLFGRISSTVFRDAVIRLSNSLAPLMAQTGLPGWYHTEPVWQWTAATVCTLILLLLVTALAVWRGRLYCNTVCPVGTLLGWLANGARWQLRLQSTRCHKCARCLEACRAQCIDLRKQKVDFSRCVLCLDCLAICPEQGFQFARVGTLFRSARGTESETIPNPGRRSFLWTFLSGLGARIVTGPSLFAEASGSKESDTADLVAAGPIASLPITPPGSKGVHHFLRHCTACGLCVTACPTRVLEPAGLQFGLIAFLRPRMNYHRSYCNFDCHRCGKVCPTGAIHALPLAEKQLTKVGEAILKLDLCVVVRQGTDCAACSEHCPTQAVTTKPYRDQLRVPELHPSLCIGCGACEYACPVRPERAITVQGFVHHGKAERRVDTPPPVRPPADFPF
ncbi:MAG: 4Fe-4S dicluster domain-containing protein [Verrucomicrobiota bacterium]|nr:4Fe-4S dicluster domain-containing protein [Limisphaera sp.]MDW8381274.1 4Fe-4S dicluster domain-containing protein [Verrucomicrobiota bacterium]